MAPPPFLSISLSLFLSLILCGSVALWLCGYHQVQSSRFTRIFLKRTTLFGS
jgi:hypothetical protein